MKVYELIEQLNKLNPDEEIKVYDDTTDKIIEIKEVYVGGISRYILIESDYNMSKY